MGGAVAEKGEGWWCRAGGAGGGASEPSRGSPAQFYLDDPVGGVHMNVFKAGLILAQQDHRRLPRVAPSSPLHGRPRFSCL